MKTSNKCNNLSLRVGIIAASLFAFLLSENSSFALGGLGLAPLAKPVAPVPVMDQRAISSRKICPPVSSNTIVDQWIPVPGWLAGAWQARKQVLLSSINLRTGEAVSGLPRVITINRSSKIGTQLDRQGGIWHAGAPYVRATDAGSFTEYQNIETVALIESLQNLLVIKSTAVVSRLANEDNSILDRFIEETISSYSPLASGMVLADLSIKDFELDGTPRFYTRAMRIEQKIDSFRRIDCDERGDLRKMFRSYLLLTGQEALIPAGP